MGIYYSQYQIILSFMYWAPIQIGKFLQWVSLTVSAMNIVGDSVQIVLGKINKLWTGEMDRYIEAHAAKAGYLSWIPYKLHKEKRERKR